MGGTDVIVYLIFLRRAAADPLATFLMDGQRARRRMAAALKVDRRTYLPPANADLTSVSQVPICLPGEEDRLIGRPRLPL